MVRKLGPALDNCSFYLFKIKDAGGVLKLITKLFLILKLNKNLVLATAGMFNPCFDELK